MASRVKTIATAVLLLVSSYAVAGSVTMCTTTTLAAVQNTSCMINGVTFDFGGALAYANTTNWATSTSARSAIDLSTITFTPYVDGNTSGFTLSGLAGVSNSTLNTSVSSALQLIFTSSVTSGAGVFLTGAAASSTATGANSKAYPQVNSTIFSDATNYTNYYDYLYAYNNNPTMLLSGTSQGTCGFACVGRFEAINLADVWNFDGSNYVNSGSGSASASFTSATVYVTSSPGPSPVPEPSSIALFASGLAGLVGLRKKLRN